MIQRLLMLLGVPSPALACASPGQVLDWKPALGGVGALGDLGWTVGIFVFTPAGAPSRSVQGKYLTVWQRAGSGSWQFVADGSSGSAPPPDRR